MGWCDCGDDSDGRPIGYGFEASCDEGGCTALIDRGLSYACGGMHGEYPGCEQYFCDRHLNWPNVSEEHLDQLIKEGASNYCARCRLDVEDELEGQRELEMDDGA